MNADNVGDLMDEVSRHLDGRDLKWHRTDDVIMLTFEGNGENRPDVTILIGPSGGGVLVQGLTRGTVAPERVVQVALACNAWNGSARMPKATVVADDPEADDTRARVTLESWLPFTVGLPDGYLGAFLEAAISGSCTFYEHLDVGAMAVAD